MSKERAYINTLTSLVKREWKMIGKSWERVPVDDWPDYVKELSGALQYVGELSETLYIKENR